MKGWSCIIFETFVLCCLKTGNYNIYSGHIRRYILHLCYQYLIISYVFGFKVTLITVQPKVGIMYLRIDQIGYRKDRFS